MKISESTYHLMELMPQAAMVVDIQSQAVVLYNHAAQSRFGIEGHVTTEMVASIMTHVSSRDTVYTVV